jgi:hypothetical protein
MSARTAETHVANALRKLGLRSRRELARHLDRVAEPGLLLPDPATASNRSSERSVDSASAGSGTP